MEEEDKKLLLKHIRLTPETSDYLKQIQSQLKNKNSGLGDAVEYVVNRYQQTPNLNKMLESINKLERMLRGMDKRTARMEEEIGELFDYNDLQSVYHGVSDRVVDTANKLVDKKIKNAQERIATNSSRDRDY